jgi:hypothetical protein
MDKKQINILIFAVIAFVVCILFNIRELIFVSFSNAPYSAVVVDLRPMFAELVIIAIIFVIMFMVFKTPKKKG